LAYPGNFVTNLDRALLPEMTLTVSVVPDRLAEVWDAIKDGRSIPKASGGVDTVGASSSLTYFLIYALILASS
jgi:hypothetical protein